MEATGDGAAVLRGWQAERAGEVPQNSLNSEHKFGTSDSMPPYRQVMSIHHGTELNEMPWHACMVGDDDEDDEMRQTGSVVNRFGLSEKIKNSKASRTPRQKVILVTLCQY